MKHHYRSERRRQGFCGVFGGFVTLSAKILNEIIYQLFEQNDKAKSGPFKGHNNT